MKKVLLSLAIIATLGAQAQSKPNSTAISMYYGTSGIIGTNASLGKFGFGISIGIKGPIGEDYSNTIGPNAFKEDIYEIVEARNVGIKLMYGDYINPKMKISGVIGYGGYSKYYNAYDRRQILSPSGYYYTSVESKNILIYGININYNIIKPSGFLGTGMGVEVGYNNYDNLHLGISLDL
jgi:hypothetical protein